MVELRREASSLGFDALGITAADASLGMGDRLGQFLDLGRHGDMDWLVEKADRRRHPNALWPEARSIIMLGLNYGPDEDPLERLARLEQGNVSLYAARKDYHVVVKKRLKALARWLRTEAGGELKVFVDTAPVMEKPLAQAAGLGWQGKHSNMVSREFGSWLFLGSIFTTLSLTADAPGGDHCGECQSCLETCPTAAFPAPYQLDARRCLSYLNIEHQGHIAVEFRKPMGNRIFGCDDCLAVCPWNKFAIAADDAVMAPRAGLSMVDLADLLLLDDAAFRLLYAGTPVKRLGRDRFLRNVLIAAGNSGNGQLSELIDPLLLDPAPLVRAMAVWALSQLRGAAVLAGLAHDHLDTETDAAVRAEWARAISA
ncbi:MAG: tRNA epoxyqueuosine(34) reductase QueG [Alphaproteobacteria bacterium]|jgi:epoxyqueuosine reductase|nr:tRNA epoxyqueuosine(34) reductase QueG [Alphaproteobacteria bacterium]MDP6253267.1 tRNA epoxyqueuosine(34) reductase QueG [Alphaproteobacteria bacterium]MDP7055372.1 tRNA epoxyqueuosine(34) reductase QueG [Alphaproteobacteria bacterium]MDP7227000.1 tRNA epoxyqueuosine(34) reductase QueG [Alphaproteobacteria bacterium]MDP7459965.1 tRNA epoxyqueuosine(34) reductase QueG [Alphaproteobacteria bacterium]